MKQTQIKKVPRKISKTRSKSRVYSVKTVEAPLLRHLRLIEHKHTGKLVSHKHTSHAALLIILAALGFFIYMSNQVVIAAEQTVNIGLTVPGPPPSSGAQITSPMTGTSVSSPVLTVRGTCTIGTFIAVYIDTQLAGSTSCTEAGIFKVNIQLYKGKNIITAQNFDNLNQPGPTAPSIEVSYMNSEPISLDVTEPILPSNPVLIPGLSRQVAEACSSYEYSRQSGSSGQSSVIAICTDTKTVDNCSDYRLTQALPTGGVPHVVVVCTQRFANVSDSIKVGILAWGGAPPYAISINWGDGNDNTVISVPKPAYVSVDAAYAVLGVYDVKVHLTDSVAATTDTETSLEINGNAVPQSILQFFKSNLSLSWFETPVPIYLTAVAVTLGFWGGDIFYRYLGTKKPGKKTGKQRS